MKQSRSLRPSPTLTAVCPGVSPAASQGFVRRTGEGGGPGAPARRTAVRELSVRVRALVQTDLALPVAS